MNNLRLKNVAVSLFLLSCALPVLGQQSQGQQTNNNPQGTETNPAPPPPTVITDSAQQMTAKAAAARQAGQIPPSPEQVAIARMTATCKITDPPPQQAELSVAPPANCAQQIQAPTDQSQTDSDVLHDEIIGDLMERATGVPMSPQKVGTEAASAALDAVANRMNSEILAKAAEFIASDTFGLPLSITLSGSEAGSPQLDQMTLDQYRAYQQQQYEQDSNQTSSYRIRRLSALSTPSIHGVGSYNRNLRPLDQRTLLRVRPQQVDRLLLPHHPKSQQAHRVGGPFALHPELTGVISLP